MCDPNRTNVLNFEQNGATSSCLLPVTLFSLAAHSDGPAFHSVPTSEQIHLGS